MPHQGYRRGPWYRGGVPRSYVAPKVFASVGCGICLSVFSVVFIIAGGAMLGISRFSKEQENKPPFDDDFFKKHRSNIPDIVGTIGGVLLGIGCTMLVIGISICIVAGFLARKQERKRHVEQQNPLASQPPPPSAYPHQPASQNVYPPASSYAYPSQPAVSGVPMEGQYQYPPQPAGFYPPPSSSASPPGNPYPPPTYDQSLPPTAPSQDAGAEKHPLGPKP